MNSKRKFLIIITMFIFAFIFLRVMNTLYYNELSKDGFSKEVEYTVEINNNGEVNVDKDKTETISNFIDED